MTVLWLYKPISVLEKLKIVSDSGIPSWGLALGSAVSSQAAVIRVGNLPGQTAAACDTSRACGDSQQIGLGG